MHRDLLDALRCPCRHEAAWLVAMVHRADGPHLRDATLSCPMCGTDYLVRDGVARFGAPCDASPVLPVDGVRLAALLGVSTGPWPILLTGAYARAGALLATLVEVPQIWLDAPADVAFEWPPGASGLQGASRLPLGVDTLAAAAIDPAHADTARLADLVDAVRVGGRLLAPVVVPLPPGVRELARDATEWVAEVTPRAAALLELRRRPGPDYSAPA